MDRVVATQPLRLKTDERLRNHILAERELVLDDNVNDSMKLRVR